MVYVPMLDVYQDEPYFSFLQIMDQKNGLEEAYLHSIEITSELVQMTGKKVSLAGKISGLAGLSWRTAGFSARLAENGS